MNNIPNYLKSKTNKIHGIFQFKKKLFAKVLPLVLYRNAEEETFYSTNLTFPLFFNFGDYEKAFVTKLEYYDVKHEKWIDIPVEKYESVIYQDDVRYLDEKFKGYWDFEYTSNTCWIKFDIKKWTHDNISPEIILDLEYGKASTLTNEKRIRVSELESWTDHQWQDIYGEQLLFHSVSLLESFLESYKEDIKVIKLDSQLKNLYDEVSSGSITYEEFVAKIGK